MSRGLLLYYEEYGMDSLQVFGAIFLVYVIIFSISVLLFTICCKIFGDCDLTDELAAAASHLGHSAIAASAVDAAPSHLDPSAIAYVVADALSHLGPSAAAAPAVVVDIDRLRQVQDITLVIVGERDDEDSEGENSYSMCAICLEKYEAREEVRVLPYCNHRYHRACIDPWLLLHSTCPTCRGKFSSV